MKTLPLHRIPAHRMAKLTEEAKNESSRRARWARWVERNIVADDPRSIEEQRADENHPDRSPVWFCLVVLLVVAFYAAMIWIFVR